FFGRQVDLDERDVGVRFDLERGVDAGVAVDQQAGAFRNDHAGDPTDRRQYFPQRGLLRFRVPPPVKRVKLELAGRLFTVADDPVCEAQFLLSHNYQGGWPPVCEWSLVAS